MKAILYSVAIFFGSISLNAQQSKPCNDQYFADDLLDKLTGSWTLSGKIGDRSVANRVTGEWVLGHQFLRLDLADTNNPPDYLATVYIGYDCISEKYVAHWMDNGGGRFSESLGFGIRFATTIELRFEYPDGPFVNQFTFDPSADAWQFHMTQKKDGQWITFGDEFLTRVKSNQQSITPPMENEILSISPNLMVNSVNTTLDFYTNILGFNTIKTVPESGKFVWGMAQSGAVSFMFQERRNLIDEYPSLRKYEQGGGLTFYISVTGVSDLYDQLKGKVKVVKEIHKTFYGATEFSIEDCNGYILTFSQDGE